MSTSALPLPANPLDANAASAASGAKRTPLADAWKNIAGYVAAACLSMVLTTLALQLWRARLDAPLFDSGDNLMSQMFVQNILESGWFLDNGRLGAPGALDLRDYPQSDVFHVAVLKLLGYICPHATIVMNLYYLLPFPLTAVSSYFVLRRFRLGRLAALVPSVLYSCTLYHFLRVQGHLFLASYFLLPPMIWVLLRVHLGRNPLRQLNGESGAPRWRLLSWEALGAALICVLTGMAGVYYAFFSCFLLLMAAIRAAFRERCWAPLAATTLLIALIIVSLAAALSPSFLYMARHGKNPEASIRSPVEADIYGLNVAELLAPIHDDRIRFLAHIHDHYFAPPRQPTGEAIFAALGLLGSCGFVCLIGRFLWSRGNRVERIDDALAYLNIAAVMLGSIGCIGSCFAFYGTPMIRCYERISIFIAFFTLAGLFLLLQRFADRYLVHRWARVTFAVGLIGLLGLGAYDQSPRFLIPSYTEGANQTASDADFGRRMEAAMPAGAMIYEMPYVRFPESAPVERMGDYELLRPFLNTRTLRFSYGAMKGRSVSRWQATLAARPLPEALDQIAFAGFSGIYLDRAGFADGGTATEAELSRVLGVSPLVSLDTRQSFFDMRPYVQGLRDQFTDEEWEAKQESALHPLELDWCGDFYDLENAAGEPSGRWCGAHGELHLTNPLDRPRRVALKMECRGWQEKPAHLLVDGDLVHLEWPLTLEGGTLELNLLVPPGRYDLTITCDGPRMAAPDPRAIYYRMSNIQVRVEE